MLVLLVLVLSTLHGWAAIFGEMSYYYQVTPRDLSSSLLLLLLLKGLITISQLSFAQCLPEQSKTFLKTQQHNITACEYNIGSVIVNEKPFISATTGSLYQKFDDIIIQ